jgi:hypothetical protein
MEVMVLDFSVWFCISSRSSALAALGLLERGGDEGKQFTVLMLK